MFPDMQGGWLGTGSVGGCKKMSPEGHHTETSISTVCTQNNIDSNIWSIP